jgi:hypothetical protein
MKELSEETKGKLISIIDQNLIDAASRANEMTLYNTVNFNGSFTMNLFSQNIEEFLYLRVAQSVTGSYDAAFKNIVAKAGEVLLLSQKIIPSRYTEPYNLSFQTKGGKIYCIDLQSVSETNPRVLQATGIRKAAAENEGKIYRLYIYDDETPFEDDIRMGGDEFWALVSGRENAGSEIFQWIRGSANRLSIATIIKDTQNRLLREWRMQD